MHHRLTGDRLDYWIEISRYLGSKIVETLLVQIETGLKAYQKNDRLHLVTHSWGTVMLFDMLFASRWHNDIKIPGDRSVQTN